MKKLTRNVCAGAASLLLGTAAMPLFAAPPQAPTPTVRATKVSQAKQTDAKLYVGTVLADEEINLTPRVSGTLWKATFERGGIVKKGDLLYQIEDTVYLENVKVAQATLDQIEAELEFAKKEYERYTRLLKTKATSETQAQSAIRTYELQKAKRAEAAARLKLAQNDLSYTKIYAPVTGRIGGNKHDTGNYITPSTGTLATIVKFDPVVIRFAMGEADFFKHSKNGKLSADGIKVVRADGKVMENKLSMYYIDNKIDNQTGTLLINLTLENPKAELLPGGYVTVRFSEVFDKPKMAVPATALLTEGGKQFVYIVNQENKAEKREVVAGPQVRDLQIIESGLKGDETVISGGLNKVRPDAPVKAVLDK